jgi:hypothetical protein
VSLSGDGGSLTRPGTREHLLDDHWETFEGLVDRDGGIGRSVKHVVQYVSIIAFAGTCGANVIIMIHTTLVISLVSQYLPSVESGTPHNYNHDKKVFIATGQPQVCKMTILVSPSLADVMPYQACPHPGVGVASFY